MTAHATLTTAIFDTGQLDIEGDEIAVAHAVMAAIRRMPHDELAELRPDIALEFYTLKEQAAQRGHYLLTTLRAHHAAEQDREQP